MDHTTGSTGLPADVAPARAMTVRGVASPASRRWRAPGSSPR